MNNYEGLTNRQIALLSAVKIATEYPHVDTITLAKTYLGFLEGRA